MTIETKYELEEKVVVSELNITGRVIAFYYETKIEYKIRYFDSGDVRSVYFFENELQSIR